MAHISRRDTSEEDSIDQLKPGLMKDHGQQARASENFAGPVDFETPWPDLPVHFFKLS